MATSVIARRLVGKSAVITGSTEGYVVQRSLYYLFLHCLAGTEHSEQRYRMFNIYIPRIGYAIARRLAQEGAKVMVSSRNQENVDRAVEQLRSEPGNLTVEGVVCHVGKPEHRKRLIEEVHVLSW